LLYLLLPLKRLLLFGLQQLIGRIDLALNLIHQNFLAPKISQGLAAGRLELFKASIGKELAKANSLFCLECRFNLLPFSRDAGTLCIALQLTGIYLSLRKDTANQSEP
jgi:hypothetical protein